MLQRILFHAQSCQLKLGVLTLPNGDNKFFCIRGKDDSCSMGRKCFHRMFLAINGKAMNVIYYL
jgi:hypothetical protein